MTPDNGLYFDAHSESYKNIPIIVNYDNLEETYQKIVELEGNNNVFKCWRDESIEEVNWIKKKHQEKENLDLILEGDNK